MIRSLTASLALVVAVCAVITATQDLSVAYATATSTTTTATSSLQDQLNANDQQIAALNQEIAADQAALKVVGADKKTLQAAINALDLQRKEVQAQVALTQHQISATQIQIQQLGGEIADTQQTVATDQAAIGANLRNLQKADNRSLMMQILSSSGTLFQAWSDINATLQLQEGVQNEMQLLQTQEQSLADSKTASKQKQDVLTSQQQSLTSQQQALAATVQSKSQLLTETNAKESVYEKLLASAEAQLASFSTFAQNAGGSKLLGNQTSCDTWGCYYNQRDTAWGNDALDGSPKYSLASDGCLVASMAMVMTHYGYHNVTPVTINTNPSNFAAYSQGSLLLTINVDGVSATRKTAAINATLATGNPVIIGLKAYGGTHFVVFTSGNASSNYLMRDPYITNGKDINFLANYSMRDIFSIARVTISG